MLSTKILLQPTTGFIALSPARTATPSDTAPENGTVCSPAIAAPAESLHWSTHITERPTWTSSAGSHARKVEVVILAGVCSYFAFGLAGALGLF